MQHVRGAGRRSGSTAGSPWAIVLVAVLAASCGSDGDDGGAGGSQAASSGSSTGDASSSTGSGASGGEASSAGGGGRGSGGAGAAAGDGGGAGEGGAGASGGAGGGSSAVVRIMAANTTSGNQQSYDPGEGIRIFQGLDPDIVLIQEFNYGDGSALALQAFVEDAFDASYAYYREPTLGVVNAIPNGIISRFPIVESGNWDDPVVANRSFAWARIDVPGAADLWAISVHFATSSATERDEEAQSLVSQVEQTVPAGDFLVIGGDLNTDTRTESCLSTLGQLVGTAAPYPADQLGNGNTSTNRTKPYDWVMVDAQLAALATTLMIGAQSYPDGLVFDSRVYDPLSDVAPVQFGDSGAVNMQHMAVVRDFVLEP